MLAEEGRIAERLRTRATGETASTWAGTPLVLGWGRGHRPEQKRGRRPPDLALIRAVDDGREVVSAEPQIQQVAVTVGAQLANDFETGTRQALYFRATFCICISSANRWLSAPSEE